MTEIIFCGTPKRAGTVQKRVRSTESYALVRSIKHTNSFIPRQLLQPTNHKHHIGGRTIRSETTLFLRQDPCALTELAEAASDDLHQYLAGVRYQRDAAVVWLPPSVRSFFLWRPDVTTLGNPFDIMKNFCLYSQHSHLNILTIFPLKVDAQKI